MEREVLGKTIKKFLDKQQSARRKYRKAVEEAYVDGQLIEAKANRLSPQKYLLGLGDREAAGIEREVLGDTVAEVLVEQNEVNRLAQRYKVDRSRVKGTGKGDRVTKKDMEAAYARSTSGLGVTETRTLCCTLSCRKKRNRRQRGRTSASTNFRASSNST